MAGGPAGDVPAAALQQAYPSLLAETRPLSAAGNKVVDELRAVVESNQVCERRACC